MGQAAKRVIGFVELEYSVEEGDVSAFLQYHTHHSAALQELRRSQMFGYAILLAIFAMVFWLFGETAVAIAILVLGPIWAAWWPARTRRLARRQVAAAAGDGPGGWEIGRYVLRLDDHGIVLAGPAGEQRLPLSAVRQVVNLPEHVLIYVGTLHVILVPRRTSKGDVASFVSELDRRLAGRPSISEC